MKMEPAAHDDPPSPRNIDAPRFKIDGVGNEISETPLSYPGVSNLDKEWIATFLQRLHAGSYRHPKFLSMSVFGDEDVLKLLADARDTLQPLPNIEDVVVNESEVVHVAGDLHGHLHDLLAIIEKFGWPSKESKYVFNGDFVDRGAWGVEVLLVLFVLKIHWPMSVYLLRGNHEYRPVMEKYGFEREAIKKYDKEVYEAFADVLEWCPLAAVISTFVKCSDALEDALNKRSMEDKDARGFIRVETPGSNKNVIVHVVTKEQNDFYEENILEEMIPWNIEKDSQGNLVPVWRRPLRRFERRVFVIHGGVFQSERKFRIDGDKLHCNPGRPGSLTELNAVESNRHRMPIRMVGAALWSDPSLDSRCRWRVPNEIHTRGYLFFPYNVEKFLRKNCLHGLIRAHECPGSRKKRPDMPQNDLGWCVDMKLEEGFACTVFSASDYPMNKPQGNLAGVASIIGGSFVDEEGFMPSFSTLEIASRPKKMMLFLKPRRKKSTCKIKDEGSETASDEKGGDPSDEVLKTEGSSESSSSREVSSVESTDSSSSEGEGREEVRDMFSSDTFALCQ